jgi:hypothetical protein
MALRPAAFLETIIAFLIPYFTEAAADMHEARTEIIDTLASYATRTRAEMLQAAQIIAPGMTTLDVLAEAKTAEMSPSMRIRYRGCANGLNRSTLQTEKALDLRLAGDVPITPDPMPDPVNDLREADVKAAIEQAQAKIDTYRNGAHSAATSADPATLDERSKRLWTGAMMDTLKQMGVPIQPLPTG